jgi:uncharacterized coiled-coil DUF342 family protein
MSTSPSWFDQEKLNRLVKKVGPKKLSEPAAATPAPSSSQPLPPAPTDNALLSPPKPSESQPLPPKPSESQALPPKSDSQRLPEPAPSSSQPLPPAPSDSQRLPEPVAESDQAIASIASTARISLVSKPTSSLSEHRSLPALPRRTTPLPGLKSLFQSPAQEAGVPPSVEMPSVITQPLPEPIRASESRPENEKAGLGPIDPETGFPMLIDPLAAGDDDLSGIWQKMALLNEELAQTIQERDHALGDINQMREQLRVSDELLAKKTGGATSDELAQVARERDEALAELKVLKEKFPHQRASQEIKLPDGVTKTKEIVFLTQERDQARKQYTDLRKQFEGLKRDQVPGGPPPLPRDDVAKVRKELEQQLDGFRLQLEEKKKEIAALKSAAPALPASFGEPIEPNDKLKAELAELKAQLAKAREDASIAQRGLALSQKALQETRETLRDATEGTSLSRHNFENLKNECASLTQQNSVLQAQNEQLSRELAAAKQRQSGRVGM